MLLFNLYLPLALHMKTNRPMYSMPGVSSLGQTASMPHLSGPLLDDRMISTSFEEGEFMAAAPDYKVECMETLARPPEA